MYGLCIYVYKIHECFYGWQCRQIFYHHRQLCESVLAFSVMDYSAVHSSCIAYFVIILPSYLIGVLFLAALPMWFEMKRRAEEAVKQENSVASVYGAPPRNQGGGASATPLSPHTANTRILTSHTGETFYMLTQFSASQWHYLVWNVLLWNFLFDSELLNLILLHVILWTWGIEESSYITLPLI